MLPVFSNQQWLCPALPPFLSLQELFTLVITLESIPTGEPATSRKAELTFFVIRQHIPGSMTMFYSPDYGGLHGNVLTVIHKHCCHVTDEQFHSVTFYANMSSQPVVQVWDTLCEENLNEKNLKT